MANLTAPNPRTFNFTADAALLDYPQAAAKIYEGSALSDKGSATTATGVAETLVAGENFMGFSDTTQDNTSGTDGSISISVKIKGVALLKVTGLTAAKLGAPVYASDGNTFTMTSTSNTKIGTVQQIISVANTMAMVAFAALGTQVG